MLAWTHEDLFFLPSIETPEDFVDFMLGGKDLGDAELHHVVLDTYPRDERLLAKLRSLFPDPVERSTMLDDEGLPMQTRVFLPVFEEEGESAVRARVLGQEILKLFEEDFLRTTNFRRPKKTLLRACLKRYCDGLSGSFHEHTYHSRVEDWLVP